MSVSFPVTKQSWSKDLYIRQIVAPLALDGLAGGGAGVPVLVSPGIVGVVWSHYLSCLNVKLYVRLRLWK